MRREILRGGVHAREEQQARDKEQPADDRTVVCPILRAHRRLRVGHRLSGWERHEVAEDADRSRYAARTIK
jgi:hypothetical protein